MSSHSHLTYAGIKHSPDIVYYNITMLASESPDAETEIPLVFNEIRDTAIVPNSKDYYLSIIRFYADTFEGLPVQYFRVEGNQGDRDKGIYTITLEYDNGAGTVISTPAISVVWKPQKRNAAIPPAPNQTSNGAQVFDDYYYIMNYQYMVLLVNETFVYAMQSLKGLVGAIIAPIEPPFMAFNTEDQTVTLYARESHYDTSVFPQIRIYFNRPMYSLYNSLPAFKFDIKNPDKKYYQLIMNRYSGRNVVTLPDFGIDQLIFSKQEYSTLQNQSPVSSILFTSSTIPVQSEQMSAPVVYFNGKPRLLNNTYNNFANIITDIQSDELGYKPGILYVPSGAYRLIDLQNDQPLKQIDIALWWRDLLGVIRPMHLAPNSSCSLKLMFRKKSLGI